MLRRLQYETIFFFFLLIVVPLFFHICICFDVGQNAAKDTRTKALLDWLVS